MMPLRLLYYARSYVSPHSYDLDLVEAIAEIAYRKSGTYDLILLTGDIATTGLKEDLEPAFEFVDAIPSMGWWSDRHQTKPTLQAGGRAIFLLPGNHDRYRDNLGDAGGTAFDQIFAAYWGGSANSVTRIVIPKNNGSEHLAVIAVDFTLEKNSDAGSPALLKKYGRGKVYRHRLDKLVDVTNKTQRDFANVAVIWAMHFPPVSPVTPPESLLELIDANDVRQAAIKNNVPLILAGHVHRPDEHKFKPSRIWSAGTSTSSPAGNGNWLHFLDIEVLGGEVTNLDRQNYKWDDNQYEFLVTP